MGLVLPSVWYVVGAILFGVAGYIFYRHGRATKRPVMVWTGVALMLYPYAVSETWMLWMIGFALSAWAFAKWNQ